MSLTLPANPSPREQNLRLNSARNELVPAFGSARQRINRKGSLYAYDVVLPVMTYADSLAWMDLEDETDTVVMPIVEPGLVPPAGGWGTPRINGGGQSGSILNVDGFAASRTIPKGKVFSVAIGGQRHVYKVREQTVTPPSAATAFNLPIKTMLRGAPANNALLEFATPMIEGFAEFDADMWTVDVARHVGLKFSIVERD